MTVTGGTGRFAGASGAFDQVMHVTFEGFGYLEWPAWGSMDGWLAS